MRSRTVAAATRPTRATPVSRSEAALMTDPTAAGPEPAATASGPSGFSLTHVVGLVRDAIPPMHPGGRPVVAAVAAAAGLVRLATGRGAGIGALATAATALFFRSPQRVPPPIEHAVLAAADGTVATIGDALPPPELGLPAVPLPRVSVFLSVLDVHVQRIPVDGQVVTVAYHPGTFLSADLDKASDDNERNSVLLRTADGTQVGVVQIAGLLARRILCDVVPGNEVAAGETYGLIRFGSRVDVYLPVGSRIQVAVGQRTIGGETVLATLPEET